MKLQLRSRSLGGPHHLQPWRALVAPYQALASNFRTQTTIEPIRPALRLASTVYSPSPSHHSHTH